MNHKKSEYSYKEACKLMPGGVNSPVRSFKSIGIPPPFINKAQGASLTDIDGNTYTDYCLSWGVGILGHGHPEVKKAVLNAVENGTSFGAPTLAESELASLLISSTPHIQKVRMVSSGTEAAMSAIRLARAFTGRDIIVKFDGCYHGHSDMLMVKSGSGLASTASSDGIPAETVNNTISLPFNDTDYVTAIFEKQGHRIAAIIVEPVPANMGVIPPQQGFLEYLRSITKQYGALLIFDEVITGFRFCFGGVQKLMGIEPDITIFGKIVGGGFPIGVYGGSHEIMSLIAPDGHVYQAGTLSGNPVAVNAGIATLKILQKERIYNELSKKATLFYYELTKVSNKLGFRINSYNNMFTVFFSTKPVASLTDAREADHNLFSLFYREMLENGIYMSPSGYEANFISAEHSKDSLKNTAEKIIKTLNNI